MKTPVTAKVYKVYIVDGDTLETVEDFEPIYTKSWKKAVNAFKSDWRATRGGVLEPWCNDIGIMEIAYQELGLT